MPSRSRIGWAFGSSLFMAEPRQLVHTEWFDHAVQKLGNLPRVDNLLSDELYRLATYDDLVPFARGCRQLRVYQTKEFLLP